MVLLVNRLEGTQMPKISPPTSPLAELLRGARLAHGLSEDDVAEELDVHQTTVSAWEIGQHPPRPNRLRAIAEAYRLDLDEVENAYMESVIRP